MSDFRTLLTLVGAGPGDPELITMKAVNALRSADVILYDALANPRLLDYARPDATRHFVGKRKGCHALSQMAINNLILDYSLEHRRIVRLKGGDPFVFGRAQEEIEVARRAGIEVQVIPGISSALAVPASTMIPVTCRGISESFWVATGTNRNGDLSEDIELAARSSATVILLMAMSKLEQITDIFRSCGKADTPVAIIQNGTLPHEKIVTGTIKDILFRSQFEGLCNPAVIVIGEVVRLHHAALSATLAEIPVTIPLSA
jgi:uroporphyrin-III C-methyltransferase